MQENKKNNKLAWLKIGINTIGTKGLKSLKIDTLCKELKVTKGCFYHWFRSKNDYEMQILQFWKQKFTLGFIALAESGKNDKEKLAILGKQCIDGILVGNRLELEINTWSQTDDKVKEFVNTVYKQRYNYAEKLLSGIYSNKKQVKKHCLILYSLIIGVEFFYRELTRKELELIFSDYI